MLWVWQDNLGWCFVNAIGNAVGLGPCIDYSLMCTDACTKEDCNNMIVVEEAICINYESDGANE